jgi:hypothetical protein
MKQYILFTVLFTIHISQAGAEDAKSFCQRSANTETVESSADNHILDRLPLRSNAFDETLLDALEAHSIENALESLRQGADPRAAIIEEAKDVWRNEHNLVPLTILADAIAQYEAEQNLRQ